MKFVFTLYICQEALRQVVNLENVVLFLSPCQHPGTADLDSLEPLVAPARNQLLSVKEGRGK